MKKTIGIFLIIIILAIIGYASYSYFKNDDNSNNKGTDKESNKNTEMTSDWFREYLTPVLKVGFKGNNLDTAADKDIFSMAVNLAVYNRKMSVNPFSKVGVDYLIPQDLVTDSAKKYFGKNNFVYNVDDGQFKYSATNSGYLSTLEFGVGEQEGPVAVYTVNSVVYSGNDVVVKILEDYNGEVDNNIVTIRLNCVKDACIVKSIE